jgi:hypothetical protein
MSLPRDMRYSSDQVSHRARCRCAEKSKCHKLFFTVVRHVSRRAEKETTAPQEFEELHPTPCLRVGIFPRDMAVCTNLSFARILEKKEDFLQGQRASGNAFSPSQKVYPFQTPHALEMVRSFSQASRPTSLKQQTATISGYSSSEAQDTWKR